MGALCRLRQCQLTLGMMTTKGTTKEMGAHHIQWRWHPWPWAHTNILGWGQVMLWGTATHPQILPPHLKWARGTGAAQGAGFCRPPPRAPCRLQAGPQMEPSLRICSRRRGAGSRRGAPNRVIRLGPAQAGRDARRLRHRAAKQSHLLRAGPARAGGGVGGGLRRQWDVQESHGGDLGSGYRGNMLAAPSQDTGVPMPVVPLGCPRIAHWHWVRGPGLPQSGGSLTGSRGSPNVGWHCPRARVYSSRLIPSRSSDFLWEALH